jgi:hypothetical protein
VDHLALEVGHLDDVVVDDPDCPDTGRAQVEECRGAEAAGADDEHPRGAQASLPVGADVGEEQVTGVPRALLGRELRAGRHQRGSCHGATITTGSCCLPGRGVTRR